jgi:phosphoglycolate phosphatase-like HAD superfamily hydrolase
MAVEAVIFDIDGTLVDTNGAHVQAWREAFREHSHDVPAERIVREIGKGGDQLVPSILGKAGEGREGKAIDRDHGEAFLRLARGQHFCVFPGVRELLVELRRRDLRVALATSSKEEYVEAVETSAGVNLRSVADLVVTADDADASKPAPDLVVAALGKLHRPPGRCVFVGDTAYDAEAARKATVACVGLLCGGCSSEEALRAAGARSVWRDPADLLAHLDEAL